MKKFFKRLINSSFIIFLEIFEPIKNDRVYKNPSGYVAKKDRKWY